MVTLLVVIAVGAGVVGLRSAGTLELLELEAYDWFIRLRPGDPPPDERILLVAISEEDLQSEGWPLPDATLAKLVELLARSRPRAIGLDIYRDVPVPPGSQELEVALTTHRQAIGVFKFGGGSSMEVSPHPALRAPDRSGFADIVVDRGGTVRRGLLFVSDGTTNFSSFSLLLALRYLQAEGVTPRADPRGFLSLGPTTIRPFESNDGPYVGADAGGYQFLLDFKGARRPFPTVSLSEALSGALDPAAIRDKVVIVGVAAVSVKDEFVTPYSHGRATARPMSGVVLHAHIVNQLLRMGLEGAAPMATPPAWFKVLWVFLWSALGGWVGLTVRSPVLFVLSVVGGALTLALVDFLCFVSGWWLPLVPPGIVWVMSSAVVIAYVSYQENLQRSMLMQLFSRHVSKEVAEAIWRQRDEFLDGGRPRPQRLTTTVLFTDLAGFTSLAEKLAPPALVEWLNEYMEAMTRQVIAHGGVINKYIGDSIMALFGVPFARTTEAEIGSDATAAVSCAIGMEAELVELNRRWRLEDRPRTGMRIGIFTGSVVAGTLGSAERSEYTVIGDPVNIASRLESLDKAFLPPDPEGHPCRILIGETTLRYLNGAFETQALGEVSLKGKEQKVSIYSVSGRAHSAPMAARREG